MVQSVKPWTLRSQLRCCSRVELKPFIGLHTGPGASLKQNEGKRTTKVTCSLLFSQNRPKVVDLRWVLGTNKKQKGRQALYKTDHRNGQPTRQGAPRIQKSGKPELELHRAPTVHPPALGRVQAPGIPCPRPRSTQTGTRAALGSGLPSPGEDNPRPGSLQSHPTPGHAPGLLVPGSARGSTARHSTEADPPAEALGARSAEGSPTHRAQDADSGHMDRGSQALGALTTSC